jgi:hypothetical protein
MLAMMKVRFRRRARLKPVHDLFDLLLRLVKTAHGYLLLANKKRGGPKISTRLAVP